MRPSTEDGRTRTNGRAHVPKRAPSACRLAEPDLPRKVPWQSRAHETMKAVLQAASELIAEYGYAFVTTNKIAERAGVSIGSLYQYFPNKTAIFIRLLEEHIARVRPVIERSLNEFADPEIPFRDAMHRMLVRLVEAHSVDSRLNRVLEEQMPRPKRILDADRLEIEVYTSRVAEILRCRNDVYVSDPIIAAHLLVQTAHALVRWLVHMAPEGIDQMAYVDEASRFLVDYVRVHGRNDRDERG
jgi:AcrR family transcriptional regulator